uniref:hypothetical protein n=1 Tax=Alloprevotella sp. TaxID=1872471 RepID=UPI004025BD7D
MKWWDSVETEKALPPCVLLGGRADMVLGELLRDLVMVKEEVEQFCHYLFPESLNEILLADDGDVQFVCLFV